jgi:hypothetical protein
MNHVRNSDFGIFVFAPDDTATINGSLLKVTRDNVVYEAGLFGGHLSPGRCFIVIPRTAKIRMPSDLLGMTVGHYEDNRTDKNYISAVATFARQVEQEVSRQGIFPGQLDGMVRELAARFECCDWIPDGRDPKDPSKERVVKKRRVSQDIETYCRSQAVNKHRLLREQRPGYCYVLLTAIMLRPEEGDADLLVQIDRKALPPVFVLHRVADVIDVLKKAKLFDARQAVALRRWGGALPGITAALNDRINKATS